MHYQIVVRFRYSVDTLVWANSSAPPRQGQLVRAQTYLMKSGPGCPTLTCADCGVVESVIRNEHRLPTSASVEYKSRNGQPMTPRQVGVFEVASEDCRRARAEILRFNDDIDEALTDALAGRYETSARFSAYLATVPQTARRALANNIARATCWIRANGSDVDWRSFPRILISVVPKNDEGASISHQDKTALLMRLFFPMMRFFRLPENRMCVHGIADRAEEDCLEWRHMPEGMTITYDRGVFRWLGGKVVSREGIFDAGGGSAAERGGEERPTMTMVDHRGERQSNARSSRAEDALRRAAEFSGDERRWMFEQLQREFGGGEPARRRERSGAPAAGSAASLIIPPPLVVVGGVVVPAPAGINPLVFPPPMNIASG